jgi:hypothetical protein
LRWFDFHLAEKLKAGKVGGCRWKSRTQEASVGPGQAQKPDRRLKEISEEERGKCDVRITSVTFHSVGSE